MLRIFWKGWKMDKAQVIDFLKGYKRALIDSKRIVNLLNHSLKEKGNESMIKDLRKKLGVLEVKKSEIVCCIDQLTDGYYKLILTEHYICGVTFEAIAENIHFSTRHVRRLHDQAIMKLLNEKGEKGDFLSPL